LRENANPGTPLLGTLPSKGELQPPRRRAGYQCKPETFAPRNFFIIFIVLFEYLLDLCAECASDIHFIISLFAPLIDLSSEMG
jgi:hypothetical protein